MSSEVGFSKKISFNTHNRKPFEGKHAGAKCQQKKKKRTKKAKK